MSGCTRVVLDDVFWRDIGGGFARYACYRERKKSTAHTPRAWVKADDLSKAWPAPGLAVYGYKAR